MVATLVTGGSGFLGRHLLEALPRSSPIVSLSRRCGIHSSRVMDLRADLESADELAAVLKRFRPRVVYHLAGCTPPAETVQYYRGNTLATVNLLRAVCSVSPSPRVVLVGSAAELGPVPIDRLPIDEDEPCRPRDPYGLSKWFATLAGLRASSSLAVVVGRLFNPIGPGLPTTQAFGRFATRLSAPGENPLVLHVGDVEARRDFLDVRDAVRALIALAERGRAGRIYHIGSGRSRPVREGLETLIRLSGRTVLVQSPGSGIRSNPSDSVACIDRIVQETGWRPTIPWEQSLRDLWQETLRTARGVPYSGPHASFPGSRTTSRQGVD